MIGHSLLDHEATGSSTCFILAAYNFSDLLRCPVCGFACVLTLVALQVTKDFAHPGLVQLGRNSLTHAVGEVAKQSCYRDICVLPENKDAH